MKDNSFFLYKCRICREIYKSRDSTAKYIMLFCSKECEKIGNPIRMKIIKERTEEVKHPYIDSPEDSRYPCVLRRQKNDTNKP